MVGLNLTLHPALSLYLHLYPGQHLDLGQHLVLGRYLVLSLVPSLYLGLLALKSMNSAHRAPMMIAAVGVANQ